MKAPARTENKPARADEAHGAKNNELQFVRVQYLRELAVCHDSQCDADEWHTVKRDRQSADLFLRQLLTAPLSAVHSPPPRSSLKH